MKAEIKIQNGKVRLAITGSNKKDRGLVLKLAEQMGYNFRIVSEFIDPHNRSVSVALRQQD